MTEVAQPRKHSKKALAERVAVLTQTGTDIASACHYIAAQENLRPGEVMLSQLITRDDPHLLDVLIEVMQEQGGSSRRLAVVFEMNKRFETKLAILSNLLGTTVNFQDHPAQRMELNMARNILADPLLAAKLTPPRPALISRLSKVGWWELVGKEKHVKDDVPPADAYSDWDAASNAILDLAFVEGHILSDRALGPYDARQHAKIARQARDKLTEYVAAMEFVANPHAPRREK